MADYYAHRTHNGFTATHRGASQIPRRQIKYTTCHQTKKTAVAVLIYLYYCHSKIAPSIFTAVTAISRSTLAPDRFVVEISKLLKRLFLISAL